MLAVIARLKSKATALFSHWFICNLRMLAEIDVTIEKGKASADLMTCGQANMVDGGRRV